MPPFEVISDYTLRTTLVSPDSSAFNLPNLGPNQARTVRIQAPVTVGTTIDAHTQLSAFYDVGSDSAGRGYIIIDVGGSVRVTAQNAYGVQSDTVWTPTFENYATLIVEGRDSATGITTLEANTIYNDGTMAISANAGRATGILLKGSSGGGYLVNTGTLTVASASHAVGVYGAHYIENSGLIRAFGETFARGVSYIADGVIYDLGKSVAVWLTSYEPHFVNTGTIEGDYALVNTATSQFGGQDLYTNRGTMVGKVFLASQQSQLVNEGLIQGDVVLGDQADAYEGRLGRVIGVVNGRDGNDSLAGGAFAETLMGGQGADTVTGGGGDDMIEGGRDGDMLDGGAGLDTLSFASATQRLILDLAAGRADSSGLDTVSGFERVVGGTFGDSVAGSAGADTLDGGAGDDTLMAGSGGDSVLGGVGTDYLRGEDGGDTLSGGAAFDDLNGNMGDDSAAGGDGDDWVVGGRDNDALAGDAGGDLVYGNLGNDTCNGGDGEDIVRGGQDNDLCLGGAGNDFVSGDKGDDTLTGGAGADIFHSFGDAGLDRVTDFSQSQGDRVMLDPGTVFTVAQVGADTVVSMTGGGQVVLQGVLLASLTSGWIFGA